MSERYKKFELVGKGSFGDVYHGLDSELNEPIAIKVVNLENHPEAINELCQEISVLSHCSLPSIIRYRGSHLVGTKLWIVMDYCAMGSFRQLLDLVGPIDEMEVLFVAREMLLALDYLHANKIIHRDIKAANILLTVDGQVKVGDFGVAGRLVSRRNSFVGSPYWMAPEVIKRSHYDYKADIWSFGITLIELLTGKPPLASIEPSRAIFIIPNNAPPRLDSRFGKDIKDFVAQCLHDDPTKRPSADELLRSKIIKSLPKSDTNKGSSSNRPLAGLLKKYREARATRIIEGGDRNSLLTTEDGDTINSQWTFGTFDSTKDTKSISDLIPNIKSLSTTFDSDQACPMYNKQANESLDTVPLAANYSNATLLANNDGDPLPMRSRSFSTTSFSSKEMNLTIEQHSQVTSSSKRMVEHKRQPSKDSLALLHRKQHSLLVFPTTLVADNPLDRLELMVEERQRERNKIFQLQDLADPIPESHRQNFDKLYQLTIHLEQTLREIPSMSIITPQTLEEEMKIKLAEYKACAEKFITLLQKSVAAINTGSLPNLDLNS